VPDLVAFQRCLTDPATVDAVRRDQQAGLALGVVGTPTLLINDLEVAGYPGKRELSRLVQGALYAKGPKSMR